MVFSWRQQFQRVVRQLSFQRQKFRLDQISGNALRLKAFTCSAAVAISAGSYKIVLAETLDSSGSSKIGKRKHIHHLDDILIDQYIESVLSQQEIYLEGDDQTIIPTAIQRHLFRSVTSFALDLIHGRILSMVYSTELLGHRVESSVEFNKNLLQHVALAPPNEKLAAIVDQRILPNKEVNIYLIPDSIERAFYISCLRVLHTVIIDSLSTMQFTVLGQTLKLQPFQEFNGKLAQQGNPYRPEHSPPQTRIDIEALNAAVDEYLFASDGDSNQPGWLQQGEAMLERPIYRELMHLTLIFLEEFCAASTFEMCGYCMRRKVAGPITPSEHGPAPST